jgi:hypothetical protein
VLEEDGLKGDAYRTFVREVVAHRTLAQREGMVRPTLPPQAYGWAEEVGESWIEWAQGAKIDVVGDLDELRPVRPPADQPWTDPDRPGARAVADAAIEALAAVIQEAARRPDPEAQLTAKVAKAVRRVRAR